MYGFDNDEESITYARTAYPKVDFRVCDAIECSSCYQEPFDTITCFTVYYALSSAEQVVCEVVALGVGILPYSVTLRAVDFATTWIRREKRCRSGFQGSGGVDQPSANRMGLLKCEHPRRIFPSVPALFAILFHDGQVPRRER